MIGNDPSPRADPGSVLPTSESSGIRLDAQAVVHRAPKRLLAPEVALGRLNRDVPEEELDLVQFAAGEVAQSSTGASQIVRGQIIDAGGGGRIFRTTSHRTFAVIPFPQTRPTLLMARHRTVGDADHRGPCVDGVLDPRGHGDGADVPTLTDEIGDDPVLLALLNPPESQGQQLAPPEPTPEPSR